MQSQLSLTTPKGRGFNKLNKINSLPDIDIHVSSHELAEKLSTAGKSEEVFKTASMALSKAKQLWNPKALYQWLDIGRITGTRAEVIIPGTGESLSLDLGISIKFLKYSRKVLASVYTAGEKLEAETAKASSNGDLLLAYIYDLIGLIVLDKVSKTIKNLCEKKARSLGWGTGPFLSPGSVHGWDIAEQKKICSIFPLGKINVKLLDTSVLSPFKTISCLIALGPEYETSKVGTTCLVCSKKNECLMKN